MDPCPFLRVVIGSLALKLPAGSSRPGGSGVHPSSSPCFCEISLPNLSHQIAPLPLHDSPDHSGAPAASFLLTPAHIHPDSKPIALKLSIYTGRRGGGGSSCGLIKSRRRLLAKLHIPIPLRPDLFRKPALLHSGWVGLGKSKSQLHLVVKSQPDPRFLFEFGAEPERSPHVFQIQHNSSARQPVFTSRFSCGRHRASRSERNRKGWSVTVHDLSGSPVAMASMVTPFVASPNTDRVSRTNPGAWLILCPEDPATWKPWGRLQAWRERGTDALGYRFELLPDGLVVAESAISTSKGGRFGIDFADGFVMSSTVAGEGSPASRPLVQVGVQHVGCREDAAAFVALAAAIHLSVDACRLFSDKLSKELDGAGFL